MGQKTRYKFKILNYYNSKNISDYQIKLLDKELIMIRQFFYDFQIKLDGSKITFSGMVIFKTSVKDECFKDLVENIENTLISECSIMKIIDQPWNGKKQFRFTYTGGDWKRDNEIKESIVNNENKSSRIIDVEYAKSLKKSLNFKMSNMNMNINIKVMRGMNNIENSSWIEQTKFNSYTLPTFTKKIFSSLDKYL